LDKHINRHKNKFYAYRHYYCVYKNYDEKACYYKEDAILESII